MAEQPYLFLIPDIGGFTKFVNATEADHSQHLTQELLECLIQAAGKNLEMKELEGDAIFFARSGEMPAPSDFMDQVHAFYVAFHTRLAEYEQNRVCDCGACRSAHTLTLKMIAHYGKAGEIAVSGHRKLHGRDVILVHRLLKNNVPVKEYVLMSGPTYLAWSEGARAAFSASLPVETTQENPEGLDPVLGVYVPLDQLKSDVPKPAPPERLRRVEKPVVETFFLPATPENVFGHLYSLELRTTWNKGVKSLDFDKKQLQRAGTKHVCHFESGSLAFETVAADKKPGEFVLAERSGPQPFLRSVGFLFRVIPAEGGSTLTIEAHPEAGRIGSLFSPVVNRFMKRTILELRHFLEAAFPAS